MTLSPVERYELGRRVLGRIAAERPAVVILDDVQWGGDAIDFAAHVLDHRDQPAGVLFLLTARDEALADRPRESAQLEALLRRPGTQRLDVPPLAAADCKALVEELLGLEGDLALQVEERSGGIPLFAVHLVGDWVLRGVLEPAASGFVLKAGEQAVLPDDLHDVWAARVAQVLATQPEHARRALQLAAALGLVVDDAEWREACREAGVEPPPGLVDALLARRLAARSEQGWSFVHGMLRESLERLARDDGQWPALSRACARMLAAHGAAGRHGVAERLGRHLVQAGEAAEALEPLLAGARERRETSDYRHAHALLDERERAIDGLGLPASDPRRGEGRVLRARIFLHEGRIDDAAAEARRAAFEAERQGATPVLAEALRLEGDAARRRGDLQAAARLYARCIDLAPSLDNGHAVAASLWGFGDVARQQGRLDEALALFERSRTLYRGIDDQHGLADHAVGVADVAWQRGELRTAGEFYGVALGLFQRLGNRYGVARSLNGLGEVSRQEGQLSRAEDAYRRALQILETIRSAEAVFPRVNLGLVALAAGRVEDARRWLEAGARDLESLGWQGTRAIVDVALLPGAAHRLDWKQWDTSLPRAVTAIRSGGVVEPDVAWAAELAGDAALSAGQAARARDAYTLALAQWQGLGDTGRAQRVAVTLSRT